MAANRGQIDQIGYVVDDLEGSVRQWITQQGVGPWTIFRGVDLQARYRGAESVVAIDVALAYQGAIQIELIKCTNEAPSPYRDAQGALRVGLHHIAWVVDDLDVAVAQSRAGGMTLVFSAHNPATRVAYLSPSAAQWPLYEFISGPGMREMMQAGMAAARTWDGAGAITEIDMRGQHG